MSPDRTVFLVLAITTATLIVCFYVGATIKYVLDVILRRLDIETTIIRNEAVTNVDEVKSAIDDASSIDDGPIGKYEKRYRWFYYPDMNEIGRLAEAEDYDHLDHVDEETEDSLGLIVSNSLDGNTSLQIIDVDPSELVEVYANAYVMMTDMQFKLSDKTDRRYVIRERIDYLDERYHILDRLIHEDHVLDFLCNFGIPYLEVVVADWIDRKDDEVPCRFHLLGTTIIMPEYRVMDFDVARIYERDLVVYKMAHADGRTLYLLSCFHSMEINGDPREVVMGEGATLDWVITHMKKNTEEQMMDDALGFTVPNTGHSMFMFNGYRFQIEKGFVLDRMYVPVSAYVSDDHHSIRVLMRENSLDFVVFFDRFHIFGGSFIEELWPNRHTAKEMLKEFMSVKPEIEVLKAEGLILLEDPAVKAGEDDENDADWADDVIEDAYDEDDDDDAWKAVEQEEMVVVPPSMVDQVKAQYPELAGMTEHIESVTSEPEMVDCTGEKVVAGEGWKLVTDYTATPHPKAQLWRPYQREWTDRLVPTTMEYMSGDIYRVPIEDTPTADDVIDERGQVVKPGEGWRLVTDYKEKPHPKAELWMPLERDWVSRYDEGEDGTRPYLTGIIYRVPIDE